MAPTMPKRKSKPRSKKTETVEVSEEDRLPGVVYIGHIPHGFYERQLNEYFSQFGKVLEIKLSRSKKTGNAKGYAFVKFQYAAVAKTVAETCHNYLFFNKLLKCEYKPLSDLHPDTFFRYHMTPNRKPKRLHNQPQSEEKVVSSYTGIVGKQRRKLDKLRALGLDIDLEDVVEIDKSRLPAKKVVKASKGKEDETPAPASVPNKAKASSKRKAEVLDKDDPSPTKTKVSPAAKRAKKADKLENGSTDDPSSVEPKISPLAKKAKKAPKSDNDSTDDPSPLKLKVSPAAKKAKKAAKPDNSPSADPSPPKPKVSPAVTRAKKAAKLDKSSPVKTKDTTPKRKNTPPGKKNKK